MDTEKSLTQSETDFILWYRNLSKTEQRTVYNSIMAEAARLTSERAQKEIKSTDKPN